MKLLSGRTNAGAPTPSSVTSSLQAALKLDTLPLREMKQMLALIQ